MEQWRADLGDFLAYLTVEKGLSRATIESYERDLLSFFAFSPSGEEVGPYAISLKRRDLSSSTICRHLVSIRLFYRFLCKEGRREKEVDIGEFPKIWQLIPEVLTGEEVDLLRKMPLRDEFVGARDGALIEVLYASGLRVSEACGLNIEDVGDRSVRVLGKGSKRGSFRSRTSPSKRSITTSPIFALKGAILGLFSSPRRGRGSIGSSSGAGSNGMRRRRELRKRSLPTRCATALRRICSKMEPIYASFRRCLATPTSARPTGIPTSSRADLRMHFLNFTRGRNWTVFI